VAEELLDVADRVWRGELAIEEHNPFSSPWAANCVLTEIAPGLATIASLANVHAMKTEDGLVFVDTGIFFLARTIHTSIRAWSGDRLHTAVYSHGHVDHVFGTQPFEEEANEKGWPAPRVIAHENLPPRFDRYVLTAEYNAWINRRQFGIPQLTWPTEYRYPDETYRDVHTFDAGGERFELRHAKGETDDHTWTWVPERKLICCGDMMIWGTPNCGNPQKVQRYPHDWARALRAMVALEPEMLLPGHGYPVVGKQRIAQTLNETAELLEFLHDGTVEMMNAGATLDDVIHAVRPPERLIDRPYLRPIYDDPEFIVRNVWRFYGGWYDGNPSRLKPAPDARVAEELAALAGGAGRLAERAREILAAGDLRVAAHLAEAAALAAPDDAGVHAVRAEVYEARVAAEPSLMAKGIFGWAARDSRERGASGSDR
jgi:alkyl sulfatase BDS1-like metallo-beta-lactamase superfamily hydrolase